MDGPSGDADGVFEEPERRYCEIGDRMAAVFCIDSPEEAVRTHGKPEICNSDQGPQLAGEAFSACSNVKALASAWMPSLSG